MDAGAQSTIGNIDALDRPDWDASRQTAALCAWLRKALQMWLKVTDEASARCSPPGVLRREAASPEEYQLVDGYAEGVQVSMQRSLPCAPSKPVGSLLGPTINHLDV